MKKTFQGTVDRSEENVFTDSRGEVIHLWEIIILLNEERGMRFNVSLNHPDYQKVQELTPGQRIEVEAESDVRLDGAIRWKFSNFKVI